ncbi:MAG: Ig domain-containing protein, partial [Terriglobales bacterium]
MRSIQWLGLSLTAVLLLLCGCSVTGGGSPQPPSALSYATSTAVYTVGMAITPDNPTSTGGAVSSYSVSPDLPAGLSLSTSTGAISGTPTVVTATAGYTVTAANSLGSAAAILTITVNGAFPAQAVPNMGQQITPLAPPGALFGPLDTGLIVNGNHWLAGQAVSTAVSPDGNTLLILTSGYNLVYNLNLPIPEAGFSNEYVFIYDISAPTPVQKQPPLQIPNSYHGIVFDPSGVPSAASSCDPSSQHFYVPGIIPDDPSNPSNRAVHDFVHVFTLTAGTWAEEPSLAMPLNHTMGNGLPVAEITNPNFVRPFPAGVAVSRDCQTLVVANYSNDTITVFKGGYPWSAPGTETDLRPGKGNPALSGIP